MKKEHEILFEPFKIGTVMIKNRFVLEPMEGTNMIDCLPIFKIGEDIHDYYVERAKNHVGLIIPGMVTLRSMVGKQWLYEQKEIFEGLKPLLAEIHSYGAKVFLQIGAGWGRTFTMPLALKELHEKEKETGQKSMFDWDSLLVAPSELPNRWLPEIIHRPLTEGEILEYVEAYGKTARLCMETGFDGVEVHAVHEGYLLDQFTTKYTNRRTDQYGGTFNNRYRFAKEVVEEIKRQCGDTFPVSLRYSVTSKTISFGIGAVYGEKFTEAGRDLEEGLKAAKYLQDAGYDMLNADNGTYDSWYWAHPPVYMPLNCNMAEVTRLKEVVEIPVVCAGRMQPDEASASISEGKLDAMGIGRQFLVDPEYIVKLEQEKFSDILPCIACHNACLPIYHYEGVGCEIDEEDGKTQGHCALNPRTFCEQKYDFGKKAAVTKSIAVIGGGIAGMTVARIAAIRGHEVTIYEKSDRLCGVFNAAAAPEFKEKDKEFIRWIQQEIESLPIKVEYNCEITTLAELTADEIIIATGAKPKKLDVPGQEKAIEATEYLLGGKVGKDVAVIGGGLTGCEIAYDLVLKGKRPVIVEMADDILKTKGLCMANSSCLRDLLRYYEVPIYKNAKLLEIIENGIVIETAEKTIQLECDDVIMSCGYMPDTRLVDGGTQQGKTNIHIVGDVKKVGNLKTAIWEAYDLAFSL